MNLIVDRPPPVKIRHDTGQPSEPSDERGYDEAIWRRCVLALSASLVAGLAAVAALVAIVDPYDSGRFFGLLPAGVFDQNTRLANASRIRDQNFDAAIFGNSSIQMVDPSRLTAVTGQRFVQLSVHGSGPREQQVLLQRFRKLHKHIEAVVLGFTDRWCLPDSKIPLENPFPFWLYRGDAEFYLNHLHSRAIERSWRRLMIALNRLQPNDPAGYRNYEEGKEWTFTPPSYQFPHVNLSPAASTSRHFPAIDFIFDEIARLRGETAVVVVLPPRFRDWLPEPGSEGSAWIRECKNYIHDKVAQRPRSAFLDFLFDTPMNRDPTHFMDSQHYRGSWARVIEKDIAAFLLSVRSGRS